MGSRFLTGALAILCLGTTPLKAQENQEEDPVEDPVMTIIRERVDAHRQSMGMVVGIIRGYGRETHAYGTLNSKDIRKVSNATVFEVGAISGVMTGSLLAQMVEAADVSLSDPVSKFLPTHVRMPTWNGEEITLGNLATHTSGLPDFPDSLAMADSLNPQAALDAEQLYRFLSSSTLNREIGTEYEYSELGMALLGHALSLMAEKPLDELIHERLFGLLKMTNTHVIPTPGMSAQTSEGHDRLRRPVEATPIPDLPGAKGMLSTAHDLNIFVSAAMGFIYAFPMLPEDDKSDSVTIAAAFETANRPLYPTGRENEEISLGWLVQTDGERIIHWKRGMTRGFSAFIGFNKKRRRGVVVLSNTSIPVDDIGFHILKPGYPLNTPPKPPRAFISPVTLEAYAGLYEFEPGLSVSIVKDGSRLYGRPPGLDRNELIPRSDQEFYILEEDAQVTFVANETGEITHLLFLKDGETHRANRVSTEDSLPQ
jgi:serine-type D-Ala-D-Ala carboxypeptidase/endopeptidase